MSLFFDLLLTDSVMFILFAFVLYFLSVLSKRLGEVMGMKKYYYLYYAGMVFIILGSIIMALPYGVFQDKRLAGDVFFATGLTLGLIVSIKYWGWLIKELVKGQGS